jgi:hypothetical protein
VYLPPSGSMQKRTLKASIVPSVSLMSTLRVIRLTSRLRGVQLSEAFLVDICHVTPDDVIAVAMPVALAKM